MLLYSNWEVLPGSQDSAEDRIQSGCFCRPAGSFALTWASVGAQSKSEGIAAHKQPDSSFIHSFSSLITELAEPALRDHFELT